MTNQQKLENLLAALGNDPDEVAAKLAAEGCFGVSGPVACPLAVYVADKITPSLHAYVSGDGKVFVGHAGRPDQAETGYDDFPVVYDFVTNFDNGHYPFLEAE